MKLGCRLPHAAQLGFEHPAGVRAWNSPRRCPPSRKPCWKRRAWRS